MVSIWLQNWVGTFAFDEGVRLLWNWELNRNQYPDWDKICDSWQDDGVKPMVYMNPYFANLTGHEDIRTNLFKEGNEKGYFAKNSLN
jgi:alpha-glucosidase